MDKNRCGLTKCIAIAHLGSPAADEVDFVLWHGSHSRVPITHKLRVLVYLVGLDLMEDDGVHVFASSQDLREASFDVFVELASFGSTIDQ
jgi:hypothetical protein